MKIYENIELSIELNNLYFKKLGLDYGEILKNEGLVEVKVKNKTIKKPWYDVYMFENEQDYLEWKEKCMERISRMFLVKSKAEQEFEYFDLLHGPVQRYLLDKERKTTLFGS